MKNSKNGLLMNFMVPTFALKRLSLYLDATLT